MNRTSDASVTSKRHFVAVKLCQVSIPSLSALLDLRVPVVELEAPCIEKEFQKLWMLALEICLILYDKNCYIDESCRTLSDVRLYDAQLLFLSLENVKHCAI